MMPQLWYKQYIEIFRVYLVTLHLGVGGGGAIMSDNFKTICL